MSWSHRAELPVEAASVAAARAFVRHHLDEHGLASLDDPVRLVASELATNALRHAQTPFTVTLSGDQDTVLLTVTDGAVAEPVHADPGQSDVGGRGITIVAALSREWGVRLHLTGGKSVWASFALPDQRTSHV